MYPPGPESLLDRLEKIVSDAPRIPFGSRVLVDPEQIFALLDELRTGLPREVAEARALLRQRDQVLQQAQFEAEQIVEAAREKARAQAEEHEVLRLAQDKGRQVIMEAEQSAREIREEAYRYAGGVLEQLEGWLTRALETVRRGRQELAGQACEQVPAPVQGAGGEKQRPGAG